MGIVIVIVIINWYYLCYLRSPVLLLPTPPLLELEEVLELELELELASTNCFTKAANEGLRAMIIPGVVALMGDTGLPVCQWWYIGEGGKGCWVRGNRGSEGVGR